MTGLPALQLTARLAAIGFILASCAAPPLTVYTLGAAGGGAPEAAGTTPLRPGAVVIEVARVTLPDYLDTRDIQVRRGSTLQVSHSGRWASRLSLGATDLLAAQLAQARPDALVTDQPQTSVPAYRLLIDISRFDMAADVGGAVSATLEANWQIVPRDAALPTHRDRARLVATAPDDSDKGVVALETMLLSRLADAIDVSRLR